MESGALSLFSALFVCVIAISNFSLHKIEEGHVGVYDASAPGKSDAPTAQELKDRLLAEFRGHTLLEASRQVCFVGLSFTTAYFGQNIFKLSRVNSSRL